MERKLVESVCYLFWDLFNSSGPSPISQNVFYSAAIQYSSFVLSIVTCIVGLAANLIVIFVTGFLMKKNKYKIWFLNLALADFTFLLILPLHAVSVLSGSWPYGSNMCKLYNFLSLVNMYAGIYILTMLNIDRAVSVAKPVWHRRFYSRRFCRCMCAVIWVSSAICSVPAIIYSDVSEFFGGKQCFLSLIDISSEFSGHYNFTPIETLIPGFPREFCQVIYDYLGMSKIMMFMASWRKVMSLALWLSVPPAVFGYCIPLCIILISNVTIAYHVRNSVMAASSRLYKVVIVSILSFFCVRTPLLCAEVTLPVCVYSMQLHVIFRLSRVQPLLYSISATNSLLNPMVYVLVGKQVRGEIRGFLQKVRRKHLSKGFVRRDSSEGADP